METASLLRHHFLSPSPSLRRHRNISHLLRHSLNPNPNHLQTNKPPNKFLLPRSLQINSSADSPFLASTNNSPAIEPEEEEEESPPLFSTWSPLRPLWRGLSALILAGQVILRSLTGRLHIPNTLQQLERVGPRSLGVCLLTSAFVGMAFTIQFVREFTRLGLHRSVGGVLALSFACELSPVVTAVVVAGRLGSAFAAELGTMQVSEQTDTLCILGAFPVDHLVAPRVLACVLALPFLTLFCFTVGMASSALLADAVYGVSVNIILESARKALHPWDVLSAMLKSQVFEGIIAVVSCAWGVTTLGGAKGVGESTTSAVVISLVGIFVADFVLLLSRRHTNFNVLMRNLTRDVICSPSFNSCT